MGFALRPAFAGAVALSIVAGGLTSPVPVRAATQIASPITWQRDTDVNRLLTGEMSGWVNDISDYQVGATFALRLVSNSYDATTNTDAWQFRLYLNPFAHDDPTRSGVIGYRMSAFGFDVNNAAGDPDVTSVTINNAGVRSNDGGTANNGKLGFAGVRLGGSFPTINPNLDVCLITDATPANCASGGNAGLTPGEYISGTIFTLNFTGKLVHVVLDNFITRMNAVTGSYGPSGITLTNICDRDPDALYNSRNCNSVPRTSFEGPTTGVPEPAVWAQLILGFGLAGAMLRRRRAATA